MQDPDVGREVVKEIRAAVKLEVFHRSSNISQDHPDRTSHGEGLSMFDLPYYVFKGVIVTFKKSEVLHSSGPASCLEMCTCTLSRWTGRSRSAVT